MGRRSSTIRLVLDKMSRPDVREFLEHQGLSTSGKKPEMIDRLLSMHTRSLEEMMELGPWRLSDWNDFAEDNFGCSRSKSYASLAEMIEYTTGPDAQAIREIWESLEGVTVADVRDHPEDFDGPWDRPPIRQLLRTFNGRTLVQNVLSDIFDTLAKERKTDSSQGSSRDVMGKAQPSTSLSKSESRFGSEVGLPEILPGTILSDGYRVVRKLGEGGFGSAYEVESSMPRQTLVAKVSTRQYWRDLENEHTKIRLVSHPNICRILDLARDRKYGPVLIVQHGGKSVREIGRTGLSLANAIPIVSAAATGLDYLHTLGIVHGDINPGNILVDERSVVRIADFGLSGFLVEARESSGVSREATMLRGYHPDFSAFEVRARRHPSPRSDQSSLALVLLWMLAGDQGYAADQRAGLVGRPPGVRTTVDRALHPDPSARFTSCTEFVVELAARAR